MAGINEMINLAQYQAGPGRLTGRGGGGGWIEGLMESLQEKQKKEEEKKKNQLSMYKTLRDSGYDQQRAYDAVMKDEQTSGIPRPTGPDFMALQQEAELGETKARTNYYNKRAVEPDLKITFNEEVKAVKAGEKSWEELEEDYPTKTDTISKLKRQLSPKVEKAGSFKSGTGGMISSIGSFFKKNQAELNDKTRKVIANLKTQADLDELMVNEELYKSVGVDIKAIKEYFGI